jgi:hypothetical protein
MSKSSLRLGTDERAVFERALVLIEFARDCLWRRPNARRVGLRQTALRVRAPGT